MLVEEEVLDSPPLSLPTFPMPTPPRSFPTFSMQTMQAMVDTLERDIRQLEEELNYARNVKTFDQIKNSDRKVAMYTGLPSAAVFEDLHAFCIKFGIRYYSGWTPQTLKTREQLLMTLMKLRLNCRRLDLAEQFGCSESMVTNVVITWIHVLHSALHDGFMSTIPTRLKNQASLPSIFSYFNNTRIVLDCTEVQIAIPSSMKESNLTYSHYKNRNTFKGLVGVAPNGVITLASKLYPGSISDKEIVIQSGVLQQTCAGDIVMADKGFLMHDIMPSGVGLNVPPFLVRPQFTPHEVVMTRSIARARVHVERAIERVKRYTILTFIPASLRQFADVVWQTCCALTNLQFPLIREPYTDQDDQ